VTLGVFLATAGLFLLLVGVTGRVAIWLFERFSR
jgi:hypothetical protein